MQAFRTATAAANERVSTTARLTAGARIPQGKACLPPVRNVRARSTAPEAEVRRGRRVVAAPRAWPAPVHGALEDPLREARAAVAAEAAEDGDDDIEADI